MKHGTPLLTLLASLAWVASAMAVAPADNPMATHYGAGNFPVWTDEIRWDNAIDMSTYANGASDFEKFENARDELYGQGGGVLYYLAGTYTFDLPDVGCGPGIGPASRGLMLKSGVVLRGGGLFRWSKVDLAWTLPLPRSARDP